MHLLISCLLFETLSPDRLAPLDSHLDVGQVFTLFIGHEDPQGLSKTPAHDRGGGVSPTLRPPLPPGKTWYPLYRRLGGPQGRSGGAEILVPTGIRSRTVQLVAQSLHRLSYRAHALIYNSLIFF